MQATTIPTRPTPTASLLGSPPGELVLKICGGEHDGRVLRLTAAKCTIGSAAGCTLRLRARGIRPIHAMILRGPAGAAIRCWSPDAQLNERGFTEALLEIGDKLQFGPISLSVVELASGGPAPRAALPAPIVNEVQPPRPARRPNRQRRKQLFSVLREERQQQSNLQATVKTQLEQLAAFEQQLEKLKSELKAPPAAPVAQPVPDDALTQQFTRTIGQLRQELEAAAKRRTLEQQSLTRQKAAWEEQTEQRVRGEVEKLRAELQTQQQLAISASQCAENYERQIEGHKQQQLTLAREVESLKLALDTRSKSEEMTRQTTAAQLEQLSQTFALVSQERDELFEQLQSAQLQSEQAIEQHQLTLSREVESLKLALETKTRSEEMTRQTTAAQLEQLSQTFALVSQERDELFEQLHSAQLQSEQAIEQHQSTLTREIESLKLALDTKTKSEEMMRQNTAAQLDQLSQTFALVSQERDELFEQLYSEQVAREESARKWQAQVEEVRSDAETKIAAAQTDAQLQIERLREEFAQRELQRDEELIAHTTNEEQRSAADAERIQELTTELETLRAEARSSSTAAQQQLEGFTQARQRWEEEIATLNARLQESEKAVHAVRTSSGELQAAVLAEAEQARTQRDSVREQMLRQQQDWTEFRSRLESAAADERELARCCYAELEEELAKRTKEYTQTQAECLAAQERVHKLEVELEQAQESLFAIEHGANQRLQQMTISMESLQLDRGSVESQIELERAEWERERTSLATCLTELQQEIAKLTEKLQAFEQQAQDEAAESQSRQSTAEEQLQSAQEQLTEWQTAAERAQQQVNELSQEVAKLQQQEQEWQSERDQLAQQQQDSTGRLQQLETSITDLQRQLDDAQRAVAVTCAPSGIFAPGMASQSPEFGSTINVNDQELAALREQGNLATNSHPDHLQNEFGGTINVNNQELAALCEQQNEALPSLLLPRNVAVSDPEQLAALQAREADLEMRVAEFVEQQQKLEEEQSTVARQRIELESFQASLIELEKSLRERAAALQQPAVPALSHDNLTHPDDYDQLYGGEPERESNPLSESEAFAAMADQVAALQQPVAPAVISTPHHAAPAEDGSAAIAETTPAPSEFSVQSPLSDPADAEASGIIEPVSEEEFDRQLEARIARVMRRETNDWQTPPAADATSEAVPHDAASEEAAQPDQAQAVNSMLDRLREAGLWKGEGTAKGDQLPSSNPPLEEGGPGLCRLNESGPIVADAPAEDQPESEAVELAAPEQDDLSLIATATPARASLLQTPAKDDDADDSIESYMSRLMQRLKTTNPEEERPSRKTTGAQQARVSQPAPVQPAPPKVTDSRPLTSLEELSPRSQAPEQTANLAAMRALANSAARGAIEVHQKRHKREKVNLRSINTLMALLVSAGLLFFWSRTGSWVAIGGVGLSLAWAIGSSLVAVMQSLTLRKAGANEKASAKEGETAEGETAE